jgi:hypothetical protein
LFCGVFLYSYIVLWCFSLFFHCFVVFLFSFLHCLVLFFIILSLFCGVFLYSYIVFCGVFVFIPTL